MNLSFEPFSSGGMLAAPNTLKGLEAIVRYVQRKDIIGDKSERGLYFGFQNFKKYGTTFERLDSKKRVPSQLWIRGQPEWKGSKYGKFHTFQHAVFRAPNGYPFGLSDINGDRYHENIVCESNISLNNW